jgi:hypothetical protein
MLKIIFVPLFFLIFSLNLFAEQSRVLGDRCVTTSWGVVCPPRGGDIAVNYAGQLVCGKGQCVAQPLGGQVQCSKEPRGMAALDVLGWVKCEGDCEPADAANCKKLN